MRVLALIYDDENAWAALSEDDREAVYARYRAFGERADGRVVGGAELQPTATATTVRVRDGRTLVTDGPFAETREQLGGYYLLEVESLEEAEGLAAAIPAASSGAVELRNEYQVPGP